MNKCAGYVFLSVIAAMAVLMAWSDFVAAHSRSTSTSQWQIAGNEITVSYSVKAYEVTRLPLLNEAAGATQLAQLLGEHLQHQVGVSVAGVDCVARSAPIAQGAQTGYLRMAWRYDCPSYLEPDTNIRITNAAFFPVMSAHVHFAKVHNGEHSKELIFTESNSSQEFAVTLSASQFGTFLSYVQLGVEHILIGIDHLAFVLSLLLICRRLKDVIWLVGGFTLGHSLTLSLVALGYVVVDIDLVEALIGFSIALVAIEALLLKHATNRAIQGLLALSLLLVSLPVLPALVGISGSSFSVSLWLGLVLFSFGYLSLGRQPSAGPLIRPAVTLVFGLVHGFGFASVLADFELANDHLLAGLLGFNIGVEIGQLLVVSLLWFTASLLLRQRLLVEGSKLFTLLSCSLYALGVYWFIIRSSELVTL